MNKRPLVDSDIIYHKSVDGQLEWISVFMNEFKNDDGQCVMRHHVSMSMSSKMIYVDGITINNSDVRLATNEEKNVFIESLEMNRHYDLVKKYFGFVVHKRVVFCDLDGTLIDTISGETFPKGIWDMKIKLDVLDKIKEVYNPRCIYITSNQGGIGDGYVDQSMFEYKFGYVCAAIEDYMKIPVDGNYCEFNDKNDPNRKPNTGLFTKGIKEIKRSINDLKDISKEDCVMVGDASGKEGQFSDSDKKAAENFEIDYIDVSDLLNL